MSSQPDIKERQPAVEFQNKSSNQEVKSELSSCQVSSSPHKDTESNSGLLASDQSVAWIGEEFLSEDLSDLDSLKEHRTISVEVTPFGIYPRKDSVISYQQGSCACDWETSQPRDSTPVKQDLIVQENSSCDLEISQTKDFTHTAKDLIVQEDSSVCNSEKSPEITFPVGPLQSFDYYHFLIAEDLNIIDIMEKVGR